MISLLSTLRLGSVAAWRSKPKSSHLMRGSRGAVQSSTTATPLLTHLRLRLDHDIAHGEAVSIGLIFAARLAQRLGRIDAARLNEHLDVVGDLYGLKTEIPKVGSADELLELMFPTRKRLTGLPSCSTDQMALSRSSVLMLPLSEKC